MGALAGLFLAAPAEAQLPSPGNNAVFNSSGTVVLSPAFIDASIFLPPLGTQASDIWWMRFTKFSVGTPQFLKSGYPSTGAVDRRTRRQKAEPAT